MEAHANVRDMGLIEAKLAYIKAWQALPEFGFSYFVIKMANGKKEVGKIMFKLWIFFLIQFKVPFKTISLISRRANR